MNDATRGFDQSLWSATAEPAGDYPQLKGHVDTSVVVVGGGFTGLSSALHLAENGIDVTVVEAQEIGFGASGRNGGQVNPGWKLLPDEIKAIYGVKRGYKILKMLGENCDLVFDLIKKHQIQCAPRRVPYLRAAIKKRGLTEVENWVRQWSALGMPVTLLDKKQTHRVMGSVFFDGSFTDARGGSLQPLSYVRGLARAASDASANLFTRSPVVNIQREHQDWIVATKQGQVRAKYLVIGTNAYTSNCWPGLEKQIIPVASLITATQPLPEKIKRTILPEGHHFSDTRRNMVYCKIDETGRFLIGGAGQAHTPTRQYDDTEHLHREAIRLYPQLKAVKWEYDWGGLVGMTQSHAPQLIELGPNAYAGLGYNGRGIAMATMMGRMMADTILGEDCPMLPEKCSPVRFHSFRNIGIGFYMALGKGLDRLEKLS